MDEEKSVSMIEVIKNLFLSSFKLVNDTIQLVHLECQLASKSLKVLLLLAVIQIVLLSTTWLSLNAVLVCGIHHVFQLHWIIAFAMDAGINMLLLLIVTLRMMRVSRNMTFPATRRLLTREEKKI